MGMTLVEKILAARSGRESVAAGDAVSVAYDAIVLGERDAARCAVGGAPRAADRVVVLPDALPGSPGSGARYAALREYARRAGCSFVPLGRGGITPHEAIDRGCALPGQLTVATDSRVVAAGGVGCLGWRIDDADLPRAIETGRIAVSVPRVTRVRVAGSPARWARGRDVAFAILRALGDAAPEAIELEGPAIDRLEPNERLEVTAELAAAGVRAALGPVDEAVLTWVRARSSAALRPVARDADARFEAAVAVDVDGLEPLVRRQGAPVASRVTELPELPLDQVVLGGDAGGRIEDLRVASRLLREHAVAAGVRLTVVPATSRCYLHAITEGIATVFLRAGATILPPMSGAAPEAEGVAQAGERVLTTGVGVASPADGVERYTAGAAVAAASAVMGRIAHPDEVLRSKREAV